MKYFRIYGKEKKENIDKGLTLQLPLTISVKQYNSICTQINNYIKGVNHA